MRVFLAGIMQGSHRSAELHGQDYRRDLRLALEQHLPDADVYDPLADNQDSLNYDDQLARRVFYQHNHMCREVDLVVAFVPEASMGTAIEMWEAHQAGRAVIAISPLSHNWVIRFCSHAVYHDLSAFYAALRGGDVLSTVLSVGGTAD